MVAVLALIRRDEGEEEWLAVRRTDQLQTDVETAMTELTNRQVAYQAALLATAKVTSLNLSDYLK